MQVRETVVQKKSYVKTYDFFLHYVAGKISIRISYFDQFKFVNVNKSAFLNFFLFIFLNNL